MGAFGSARVGNRYASCHGGSTDDAGTAHRGVRRINRRRLAHPADGDDRCRAARARNCRRERVEPLTRRGGEMCVRE